MDEQQQKVKYRRAGSLHNIRIRPSIKPNNINNFSPRQQNQKQQQFVRRAHDPTSIRLDQQRKQDFGNILKKIPKTVELQDNLLVQGCFSYVDEGFQKWKIGKIIGKGNSCVRKAMNVKTGVISAVKQIIFGSQEQQKERLDQIQILKKLNHQNIVAYLEHYKIKSQTWIFMEYVPTNLKKFYLDFGAPPPQVFLKFAKQIVSALAFLQRKNVIHKDIKCENILLDNQGVLKLCDFGCSKDFRSTMSLKIYQKNEAIKSFKGSYLWTAPQCLIGKVCLASDIWSLGCLLIQLASGALPWAERNFDNQLQAIQFIVQKNETPKIQPEWDPKIKQIISCCLKRKPQDRITAVELLERKDFWQ